MASIVTIPDELLLSIFSSHVWANKDTPQRLIRICRRWHSIVIDTPSLWGNIIYTDQRSLYAATHNKPSDKRILENKIFCNSLSSLARAIERTGGSQFELMIFFEINPFHDNTGGVLHEDWFSSRCRALQINLAFNLASNLALSTYSIIPLMKNLSVLQTLCINTLCGGRCPDLEALLKDVQQNSQQLRELQIRFHSKHLHLNSYPRLASRLKVLRANISHIGDMNEQFKDATTLEELQITRDEEMWDLQTPLNAFSPALRKLHIIGFHPAAISGAIYANLTHLRMTYTNYPYQHSFHLPKLTHLSLSDSYKPLLQIDAPVLHTLKIQNRISPVLPMPEAFQSCTLQPKRLDIELVILEFEFVQLLQQQWSSVEDLRVVYVNNYRLLQDTLCNALIGVGKEIPICPNLWRLVVIAPNPEALGDRKASEGRLQRVVDSRRNEGLLKQTRYGWYPGPKDLIELKSRSAGDGWLDEDSIGWVDMQ